MHLLTLISFFWTIFWSLSCYPLLMSSLMAIKAPSWNIELANILFWLVAYCLPYSGLSWTSSMKFKARSYYWEISNVMWTCIKLIYFCYASNWHFLAFLCTVLHIAVRLSESLYSVEGIGENGMLIDVLNWLSRLTASVTCFLSSRDMPGNLTWLCHFQKRNPTEVWVQLFLAFHFISMQTFPLSCSIR